MNFKHIISIGLFFSISLQVIGQTYHYYLPYNWFKIEAKITKQVSVAGPYADHADLLSGIKQPVIEENSTHYYLSNFHIEIQSGVDTNCIFPIQATHFAFSNLANKGLLLDMGVEKNYGYQQEFNFEPDNELSSNPFYMYVQGELETRYDTVYEDKWVDSVLVKEARIVSRLVVKTDYEQAQDVIDEIEDIRSDYYDIISGVADIGQADIKVMLDELKKKEDDLSILFTGYSQNEETTYNYTVVPENVGDTQTFFLFDLSPEYGIDFDEEIEQDVIHYELQFCKMQEKQLPVINIKASKNAFYYRHAEYYRCWLLENGERKAYFGIYPIAQAGTIKILSKATTAVEINPFTGELKSITTKFDKKWEK